MVPYFFVTCRRTKSNWSCSLESITTVYICFDIYVYSDPLLAVNNIQYILLTVEQLHVLRGGQAPPVEKLGGPRPPCSYSPALLYMLLLHVDIGDFSHKNLFNGIL